MAASPNVIWKPNPGSQTVFMRSPVFETLYGGGRGIGKSEALLMSFLQYTNRGFGPHWRGVIYRENYKQLSDIISKSKTWFPQIYPDAVFLEGDSKLEWRFPQGEVLIFRHMRTLADAKNALGHEYGFMGFEELTNWPEPSPYTDLIACCRAAYPGMPRMVRSTTNPWGPGLQWVKKRFRLPERAGQIIQEPDCKPRVAVLGRLEENIPLLENDPDYRMTVASAAGSKEQLRAWLDGDWNVAAGGMFDEVWSSRYHVLYPFKIPRSWFVCRSLDWGDSKPFSVGWWAESDGSLVETPQGLLQTVRGDLFYISEWYGWDGNPNRGCRMLATEVAKGILDHDQELRDARILDPHCPIRPGPADTSIFTVSNGRSVGEDMLSKGVLWDPADKSAGSRVRGWRELRTRLKNALPPDHPAWIIPPRPVGTPREEPALFVFDTCRHFIRTIPALPRSDRDPDDVNSDAEDHVADQVRYRLSFVRKSVTQTFW